MADTTTIEWTDATWNPWQGCHKVSPGCDNCYMMRDKKRYGQDGSKVVRSSDKTFFEPVNSKKWLTPKRVFVCSWSDFFIEEADAWRKEAWNVIFRTPHLTYQILTKRPERMLTCLPPHFTKAGFGHVHFGVTAENQEQADKRIPILLEFKAVYPWIKTFVSIEPMIGAVDIEEYLVKTCTTCGGSGCYEMETGCPHCAHGEGPALDHVILGGESGAKARPMHPDWARKVRDDCKAAGVAFFFKQWGEWLPVDQPWKDGTLIELADNEQWLNFLGGQGFHGENVWRMRYVGKKKAGSLLDGVEHKEGV